jgi:hypothetical protein
MYAEFVIDESNRVPEDKRPEAVTEALSKCVVEAFNAKREGRAPSVQKLSSVKPSRGAGPREFGGGPLHTYRGEALDGKRIREFVIEVSDVKLDERGIVEVWCSATLGSTDYQIDCPVYLVDAPIFVEDEDGDIEHNGVRYREDPIEAIGPSLLGLGGVR